MAITREEKTLALAIKEPRIPVVTVEGFYDGERAVFLCFAQQHPVTGKTDLTPVAMLLREEDIEKVTRPKADDEKPPEIEVVKG